MATGRDTNAVKLGPGRLFIAPIGTAEPTLLTGALDAGFIDLGYTIDGSAFNLGITAEDVEVAEELEPIDNITTGRVAAVTFQLAQMTAQNLAYAFNGGTIVVNGQYYSFEPPDLGSEIYRMLIWQDNTDATSPVLQRWLFRKVKNASEAEIPHRKGAAIQGIPITFRAFKPSSAKTWKAWLHPSLSGA